MKANPIWGSNTLKLGVFSIDADGGLALATGAERRPADWDAAAVVARMAGEMRAMSRVGCAGRTAPVVNFKDELPFFIKRAPSLMIEQAGLCEPQARLVRPTPPGAP